MKPKHGQPKASLLGRDVHIIGELKRFQTRKTPMLMQLAKRFPGRSVGAIKELANYVFRQTPVDEKATLRGEKFSRHAEKILQRGVVDTLHCYDRSHALIGILNAKKMPAWMVVTVDWRDFVHTYVETFIGKELYTIAFQTYEPPLIVRDKAENAIEHVPETVFLRAMDFGNLGVQNREEFKRMVQQINLGKAKGTIRVD